MSTERLEKVLLLHLSAIAMTAYTDAMGFADTSLSARILDWPFRLVWSQQYEGFVVQADDPRLEEYTLPNQVFHLTAEEREVVPRVLTMARNSLRAMVEQLQLVHGGGLAS